ncbi:MAG: C10 family peptidase [Prevotella sp.]|nr:C10 family peptidase [Prevotella sp.]
MKSNIIKLVVLWSCLLYISTVCAAPLSPHQAKRQATLFLNTRGKTVLEHPSAKVPHMASLPAAEAAYYVFDVDGGGFVVVSGDDLTAPVLGYSDKGTFSEDDMPEGLQWLLQSYAEQIGHVRAAHHAARPSQSPSRVMAVRHNIEPLLSTLWNQGHPYNLLCPQYYNQDGTLGDRCATGCVATAIAQVMAYYKYPASTKRTIPGYVQYFDTDKGSKSVQLRNIPANSVIDWEQMLDAYGDHDSEQQQQAVAQLMYWVGLGCKMGYGPSSAAGFPEGVNALKRYFGYDDGTHIESRSNHTMRSWDELLYKELETGHPIAFAGTNSGGAHAFVLDGYDIDGLFHVNWGWGGMNNGYFRIDVLDPDNDSGIGASPTPGGYNMGQDAIIGMRLPDDVTAPADAYRLTVNDWEIRRGNVFFANYVNWSSVNADWNVGIARVNDDGSLTLVAHEATVHLDQNYYQGFEFAVKDLPEGTSRIVPVSKRTTDQKWQTHVNPDISYVEAGVDASGQMRLVIHPIEQVELTEVTFPGDHRRGSAQPVCATFHNYGEEYYHEVFMFAGTANQMGQSLCRTAVAMSEGGETTSAFHFTPDHSGTWTVWLATDDRGSRILGKAEVEISDEGVSNNDVLRFVSMTVENRTNSMIYGNCAQGKVTVVNQGAQDFEGKIRLWLFKLASDGYYYGVSSVYKPIQVARGKMAKTDFFFDHLDTDATYTMSILYETGGDILDGGLKPLGTTKKGIVCWLSDKTLKGLPPSSMVNSPSNALAVDMSNVGGMVSTVHPNDNPNTLYILAPDAPLSEGLEEANVVRGNQAETIHLVEGKGFFSPMPFTASTITFECMPMEGRWQTIALPFTPESIPEGMEVMQFAEVDDDGMPVFAPTSSMQRHIPYLFHTDASTPTLLSAHDAKISATRSVVMVAGAGGIRLCGTTMAETHQDVMVLNTDGDAFVASPGQVKIQPFRAFLSMADTDRIVLPSTSPDSMATSVVDDGDDDGVLYNLSGQRVTSPLRGIYVKNHKKVLVW